jgi:hypothetical protein
MTSKWYTFKMYILVSKFEVLVLVIKVRKILFSTIEEGSLMISDQ